MFCFSQINTTEIQDIDLSRFVPQEVDNTGITVASMDRFTSRNKTKPTEEDDGENYARPPAFAFFKGHTRATGKNTEFGLSFPEEQLNGACGGAEANGLSGADGGGEDEGGDGEEEEEVPVDENLFTGEDLEELDEELNTLALEE